MRKQFHYLFLFTQMSYERRLLRPSVEITFCGSKSFADSFPLCRKDSFCATPFFPAYTICSLWLNAVCLRVGSPKCDESKWRRRCVSEYPLLCGLNGCLTKILCIRTVLLCSAPFLLEWRSISRNSLLLSSTLFDSALVRLTTHVRRKTPSMIRPQKQIRRPRGCHRRDLRRSVPNSPSASRLIPPPPPGHILLMTAEWKPAVVRLP